MNWMSWTTIGQVAAWIGIWFLIGIAVILIVGAIGGVYAEYQAKRYPPRRIPTDPEAIAARAKWAAKHPTPPPSNPPVAPKAPGGVSGESPKPEPPKGPSGISPGTGRGVVTMTFTRRDLDTLIRAMEAWDSNSTIGLHLRQAARS